MLAPIARMPELVDLISHAGAVIMEHYEKGTEVWNKDDRSPVTAADQAAEKVIIKGLKEIAADIPIVAEEEVSASGAPQVGDNPFWLVDPLDGTKEFLSRNGEFTVNIALISERAPILGIVHAPALGRYWWGVKGQGATVRDGEAVSTIRTRRWPDSGAVAVASRSHRDDATNAWLEKMGISETRSAGSSLKLCLVASGEADVYPRFGRTMEWDIAAGHAVLAAAGGVVTTADGSAFGYGKEPVFDNPAFIAWGDPDKARAAGA
jgi:3'(2'), 5'-bisphosphate nucleotidase